MRNQQQQMSEDIAERLRAVVIPRVTSHSTVGEAFTVPHSLGTTPSMVAALPTTDCRVWAQEDDERIWDEKKIVLRCSVADAPLRLVVIE